MPDRDEIMGRCIADLKNLGHEDLDVTLLDRLVEENMPEILDRGERVVASSDGDELRRVKNDFLIGRLGMPDGDSLMGAIQKAIREYGHDNPYKLRPVVHYLLVKDLGKEDAFA